MSARGSPAMGSSAGLVGWSVPANATLDGLAEDGLSTSLGKVRSEAILHGNSYDAFSSLFEYCICYRVKGRRWE